MPLYGGPRCDDPDTRRAVERCWIRMQGKMRLSTYSKYRTVPCITCTQVQYVRAFAVSDAAMPLQRSTRLSKINRDWLCTTPSSIAPWRHINPSVSPQDVRDTIVQLTHYHYSPGPVWERPVVSELRKGHKHKHRNHQCCPSNHSQVLAVQKQ